METPVVSFIVSNFNYGRFLSRCLDSLIGQETVIPYEIVVVDDGSTDNSREILRHYSEDIHEIIFQENAGQAAAMNAGFLASHGELVWFVDSDDEIKPEGIDEIVRNWIPGSSLLQFGLELIDQRSLVIGEYPALQNLESGFLWDRVLVRPRSRSFVYSPTSGVVYNRKALLKIMPLPEDAWRIAADGLLVVLASHYGTVQVLRRRLARYRFHGSNAWAHLTIEPNNYTAERRRVFLEHDMKRRLALHNYLLLNAVNAFEEIQGAYLGLESEKLYEVLNPPEGAELKTMSLRHTLEGFEKMAISTVGERELSLPGADADVWLNCEVDLVQSTRDWPDWAPWIFGFDRDPWSESVGFLRALTNLCGFRFRRLSSNEATLHFCIAAALGPTSEEGIDVYANGTLIMSRKLDSLMHIEISVATNWETQIEFHASSPIVLLHFFIFPLTDFTGVRSKKNSTTLSDVNLNLGSEISRSLGDSQTIYQSWSSLEFEYPPVAMSNVAHFKSRLRPSDVNLWCRRPDLQESFDIGTNWGRLQYFAWLVHCDPMSLGVEHRSYPVEVVELCAVLAVTEAAGCGEPDYSVWMTLRSAVLAQGKSICVPLKLAAAWTSRSDLRDAFPSHNARWLERLMRWWDTYGRIESGLMAQPGGDPEECPSTAPKRLIANALQRLRVHSSARWRGLRH